MGCHGSCEQAFHVFLECSVFSPRTTLYILLSNARARLDLFATFTTLYLLYEHAVRLL